jgi:hypothetical protein
MWVEYVSRNYTNLGIVLFPTEISVKCEVIYMAEHEKCEIGFCVSGMSHWREQNDDLKFMHSHFTRSR